MTFIGKKAPFSALFHPLNLMGAAAPLLYRLPPALVGKDEEPLAQVVQPGEQAHPHHHSQVLLQRLSGSGQGPQHRRLRRAVGHQIADQDIPGKAQHLGGRFLAVLEGEELVQKEAQNAGEGVVGGGGHPVGASRQVVQPKHDSGAHHRVDYPHRHKFQQLPVNDTMNPMVQLFHIFFFHNDRHQHYKHQQIPFQLHHKDQKYPA